MEDSCHAPEMRYDRESEKMMARSALLLLNRRIQQKAFRFSHPGLTANRWNSMHRSSVIEPVPAAATTFTNNHYEQVEIPSGNPPQGEDLKPTNSTDADPQDEQGADSACIIVPAVPLEEKWISLSKLDKFILPIYIPIYLIYESVPQGCFNELLHKLRTSLAEVLVPYYPFAGRIKLNQATQSWDVHCDNAGAEFRVVYLDEELKNTKFSNPCLECRLLAPRIDAVPRQDGPPVPALSVKVTRFRCGAVALGCSFHHQVGDAHGVAMFLQAWSKLARGKPICQDPVHDRSLFVPATSSNQAAAPPPAAIVGTRDHPASSPQQEKQQEKMITLPSVEEDFGDFALEGLLFQTEDLTKLKAMAPGSTSFEATTAFVVRHILKAAEALDHHRTKNEDDSHDQLAKFVLMVDFRGRFGASNFAGNFALPKAIIVPKAKFLQGSLADAVEPVHEAVIGADEAYFNAFIRYAGRGPPSKERALAVSSCARVPLYDVDFGYGGAVFAGINPPVPRLVPEFLLYLPNPRKSQGGFVIYLQLQKDVLQAVLEDPEFSSIARKYRPLEDDEEEQTNLSRI